LGQISRSGSINFSDELPPAEIDRRIHDAVIELAEGKPPRRV